MDFMKFRKITYIFSLLLLVTSLSYIFVIKGFYFGIDFTGGILIQVKFNKSISEKEIRGALEVKEFGHIIIQRIGQINENLFIIKSKQNIYESDLNTDFNGNTNANTNTIASAITNTNNMKNVSTIEKIQNNLIEKLGAENVELPFQRSELVGPAIGKDLRNLAFLLVIISLIANLIYISIRFQFKFAVAAIIALVHDVLITAGVFSFLGKEINIPIIAAILTIIGYSLNDTIVVFDRIRENLKLLHGQSYANIINSSIRTTLNRTIITSITTLLAVMSLYFWGGTVIHDFAFAFIIGIIAGTYSSIFVASPILYEWWQKDKAKRKY